ncbi:MAG: tetratricopeptide repeat protein [Chloroflexota bacterium]
MSRKWTDEESRWLRDNHARMDVQSLSQRLGVPIAEVEKRLKQMKLVPEDEGSPLLPARKAPATMKELVREISAARREYEKAMELFHRRDLVEAAKRFEAIVEKYPDAKEYVDRAKMYLTACRTNGKRHAPLPSSPEELYHAAVFEKNRGQVGRALELLKKVSAIRDEDARALYLAACCHALAGTPDEAIAALRRAITADPSTRIHARLETDLASLRGRPGFSELLGA